MITDSSGKTMPWISNYCALEEVFATIEQLKEGRPVPTYNSPVTLEIKMTKPGTVDILINTKNAKAGKYSFILKEELKVAEVISYESLLVDIVNKHKTMPFSSILNEQLIDWVNLYQEALPIIKQRLEKQLSKF